MDAIIYTTNTGSTEQYAKLLAQKTGLPTYSLAEAKKRDFVGAEMRRVVRSGSLAEAFRDLPVTAGAKTGSAQVAGEEESNAVLVCFAPYDAPKIALALVAEQGGSGAALGDAAAAILNTWAAGNLS